MLLHSAANNPSGVPQRLLDEKAEELRKKKETQDRINVSAHRAMHCSPLASLHVPPGARSSRSLTGSGSSGPGPMWAAGTVQCGSWGTLPQCQACRALPHSASPAAPLRQRLAPCQAPHQQAGTHRACRAAPALVMVPG